MPYVPSLPPFNLPEEFQPLIEYFQQELEKISQSQAETTELELRVRNAEPEKPREGMQVYADGTNWDPGEGAGQYTYTSGGWVKSTVASDLGALAVLDEVALTNIEDLTADVLLGREGTTGAPEELTLGAGLAFSGKSVECTITQGDPIPAGTTVPYAGTSAPSGWLFSYGQAVSRTTYADLFTAIGTTYGVGDGSTTFNLPDLRGRVVAGKDDMGGTSANRLTDQSGGLNGDVLGDTGGAETHTLTVAEMPSHSHELPATTSPTGSGEIEVDNQSNGANSFSTLSTGGDGAHNNVQPTIILNYIIKT